MRDTRLCPEEAVLSRLGLFSGQCGASFVPIHIWKEGKTHILSGALYLTLLNHNMEK